MSEVDDARKRLEQAVANADPKLIEKYGNPLDPKDPRHWEPSDRGPRGLSANDRIKLLELDVEVLQNSMGQVVTWMMQQQSKQFLEELQANPRAAIERLAKMTGQPVPDDIKKMIEGTNGPAGDNGPMFAGSVKGAPADALVVTPQGTIRVDQIPGYKDDPDWLPSADWVEMNCMCPTHVNARENNAVDDRFDFLRDDGRGGMYP